jgi:hypothetical protein
MLLCGLLLSGALVSHVSGSGRWLDPFGFENFASQHCSVTIS